MCMISGELVTESDLLNLNHLLAGWLLSLKFPCAFLVLLVYSKLNQLKTALERIAELAQLVEGFELVASEAELREIGKELIA